LERLDWDMEVKKYMAKTIEEATAKVKTDLGLDAMIISTRKMDKKIGDSLFEITAIPSGNGSFQSNGNVLNELKSELISIKEMIYILNHSSGMEEDLMKNQKMLSLYAVLIRNGISEKNAKVLLTRAGAFKEAFSNDGSTIRSNTIKEIMKVLNIIKPFDTKNGEKTIAALIGTTGVGKTTTIAKLAARLMLKGKKRVGLISIDNYRIGALEQLRTYANILGVPCFPAFNRTDLLYSLKRLDNCDVILIDTAGQSQYDLKRIGELNRTLCDGNEISTHLLLSAATVETAMYQTAINFSALNFQSYIFTKIDEVETCGVIINQMMKQNIPISFLTNGQNVPEDIEIADKQKILEYIFNGNRMKK